MQPLNTRDVLYLCQFQVNRTTVFSQHLLYYPCMKNWIFTTEIKWRENFLDNLRIRILQGPVSLHCNLVACLERLFSSLTSLIFEDRHPRTNLFENTNNDTIFRYYATMPPLDGYEAIPDVRLTNGNKREMQSPQEKYPEANEDEAELLVSLDEIIAEGPININLSRIASNEIGISSGLCTLLCSLTFPTFILLVLAGIAVWIGCGSVPDFLSPYIPYFPYVVAILGFIASTFPIRSRFRVQAIILSSFMATMRPDTIEAVENVVLSVASKIDLVNMRLNLVADCMKPKFSRAKKAEKALKNMDPHLQIPDPSTVESELKGAKDEVNESIKFMEKDFPVTPWIPKHLLSPRTARSCNALLFFFMVLHLAAIYGLLNYIYPMEIAEEPVDVKYPGLFRDIGSRLLRIFKSDNMKFDATTIYEEAMVMLGEAWPIPLIYIAEVYAMVFIQLTIVFFMTNSSSTSGMINKVRTDISDNTVLVLRQQGIVFLCQDILETRMGRVRQKLLGMISQLYKIDMLMTMANIPVSPTPTPRSSPPQQSPTSPSGRFSGFFSNSSISGDSSDPSPASPSTRRLSNYFNNIRNKNATTEP